MKVRRPPSWDASGLVEKAWKRLDPPTRDELAKRLKLKAPTNLTKMNTGAMPMTIDYAERIARVVPDISVADLGAPSSVAVVADPTVLDRLEEVSVAVAALTMKVDKGLDLLNDRIHVLEKQADRQGVTAPTTLPRKRKAG